jgi:hypothetical protein
MKITIDEVQVQEILDEQAAKGIKAAFEGYAVRSTLEKAIADSVIPGIMTSAITKAASSIDIETLTQHLAEEMARSITKGVQLVIRETLVNVILDIKKIPDYEREKRAIERQHILNRL